MKRPEKVYYTIYPENCPEQMRGYPIDGVRWAIYRGLKGGKTPDEVWDEIVNVKGLTDDRTHGLYRYIKEVKKTMEEEGDL